MKSVVTISRYWNNPKITTSISTEGIALQTDITDFVVALKKEIGSVIGIDREDFVKALKDEIGSVTWVFKKETFDKQLEEAVKVVFTKDTFDKQLDKAVFNVVEKIKEESIKAV